MQPVPTALLFFITVNSCRHIKRREDCLSSVPQIDHYLIDDYDMVVFMDFRFVKKDVSSNAFNMSSLYPHLTSFLKRVSEGLCKC